MVTTVNWDALKPGDPNPHDLDEVGDCPYSWMVPDGPINRKTVYCTRTHDRGQHVAEGRTCIEAVAPWD